MKVDYLAGVSRVTVKGVDAAPSATSLRRSAIARATPLLGRVVGGRYRIETVLGRGTTSIVCRASRVDGGEPVAVKVLSPVSSELVDAAVSDRFQFEARALAELHHPNVVAVLDSGATEDGLLYTIMEVLEGETLARRLASRGRLEAEEAVKIACGVADGLEALHARKLLHRDVKPANVFLARGADGAEVVKVMDLGLARVMGAAEPGIHAGEPPASSVGPRRRMHTQEGLVLGTGPYMSPELIQGRELDARSDVYALGVVTYRMLSGTLPFAGSDLPHLLSLHLCDPVEPLTERAPSAGLSSALDRVVRSALEKDRERRPATARDFAERLRTALAEGDDFALLETAFKNGDFARELGAALEEDVVDAASGVTAVRRRKAQWLTGVVFALATALAAFALVRHGRVERSSRRETSTSAPPRRAVEPGTLARGPWELVVGSARLDPPVRATAPARGKSRLESKSPRARDTPPAPAAATGAPAGTTDDLKVPAWRTAP